MEIQRSKWKEISWPTYHPGTGSLRSMSTRIDDSDRDNCSNRCRSWSSARSCLSRGRLGSCLKDCILLVAKKWYLLLVAGG